jgi:hypothetical protein
VHTSWTHIAELHTSFSLFYSTIIVQLQHLFFIWFFFKYSKQTILQSYVQKICLIMMIASLYINETHIFYTFAKRHMTCVHSVDLFFCLDQISFRWKVGSHQLGLPYLQLSVIHNMHIVKLQFHYMYAFFNIFSQSHLIMAPLRSKSKVIIWVLSSHIYAYHLLSTFQ